MKAQIINEPERTGDSDFAESASRTAICGEREKRSFAGSASRAAVYGEQLTVRSADPTRISQGRFDTEGSPPAPRPPSTAASELKMRAARVVTGARAAIAFAFFALLFAPSIAQAEHFAIQLTVSSAADKQMSFSDTCSPQRPQGFKPRPEFHVKAGEEIVLQYFLSSNFPHDAIKNVTIRYYIVPEAKAGQDAVPSRDGAIIQGHFVMDFKPETGKVGLRERLKIEKKGTYLVRVESENSATDHEHFSAIDLVVE